MRKILFFLAVAVATNLAQAAFVEESSARKVAESWFNHRSPAEARGRKIVKSFITANQNLPVFYTYGFENGGFVIVSADDAAEPIIGYSYTSPISEQVDHPAVKSWLDNYSEQIKEISVQKASNANTLPIWEDIRNGDFTGYKNSRAVEPLVKSTWDQGSPYDLYVPSQPGTNIKAAVGCVATAMAQIMNYYQWPIVGQGSNTYTPSLTGQSISANFGTTTYEWAKMPDGKLLGNHPEGAKHAVALLSYHCGIAVNMMYDIPANGGSGAYSETAIAKLKSNFKYKSSANMKNRSSYSQTTWDNMLKAELNLNRPLYYAGSGSGGGHAFICDGYQDADNKFHFNWGWNGSYDGYFASNALNPEGVGTGGGSGGFNSNQRAFFDLWDYSPKPQKIEGLSVLDVGNGTQLKLSWNKNNSVGVQKYKVYEGTQSSYTYDNSYETMDTVYTISGLTPGVQHYLAVTALDAENDESKIVEISFTPNSLPLTPSAITVEPQMNAVKILWLPNQEIDLAGYNIYKSSNNTDFTKINTTTLTNTHFVVNNLPSTDYSYFKVSAVDTDGNEGALSTSIKGRPVTLNQGVLIVDESINGTGTIVNPNDTMQDQFYNAITADVTNKSHFDATSAGKVSLSELGPYSTVIWHNHSVELNSIFYQNQADVKKYLDFGGKMLILADKPSKLIEGNNSYPVNYASNSVAETYFGIDSAYYKAAGRCSGATPFATGYGQLTADTTKTTVANGEHIKKMETLSATNGSSVIYKYDSDYPASNSWGTEIGKPLGLEKITSDFKTVVLALPLYYIKESEAKSFVNHVLKNKFNETVGIDPESAVISDISIIGNYPNPFNPATTIKFFNPAATNVKIAVYNAKGELVHELFNGVADAGMQSVKFDATGLNSGVYFYRLTTEKQNLTGKMLLVK